MKRISLFLLIFASILTAVAQESLKFFYNDSEFTDTVVMYPRTMFETTEFTVGIQNITENPVSLTVSKEVITSAGDSYNTFCMGTCFDSSIMVSPTTLDLAAGETSTYDQFHLVYNPLGAEGLTIVRYTMSENNVQLGSFVVVFDSRPVGIEEQPMRVNRFTAYPNPATNQVTIQYDLSNRSSHDATRIVITNMVGKKVRVANISNTSGKKTLDISDLGAGIYFYTLEINGTATNTKKLIVK